ncbi:MAG: hypothetical protein RIQ81_988 [Pseudomonadota bacterium]
MANVYRALDEKLGRYVAVKILHDHLRRNPDIRSRFQQEAQAVSTLDHPNIMRIYDFSGPEHEQLWLVAELISGTTLASMQQDRAGNRFQEVMAACIVREVCRALEHAHRSGIVHRDIKPENVMVTSDGRLKLMDFGIAKDTQRHRKTQTGMFMGSPSYMSPEQVKGKNVDARSDIFSLGVLFYELLTGRLPFEAASSADVVIKITAGEFVYPRFRTQGLSIECDRLVVRSMQKNPESRFQSATELGNAIDTYLSAKKVFSSAMELESFISRGTTTDTQAEPNSGELEPLTTPVMVSGEPQITPARRTKIRTAKPRLLAEGTDDGAANREQRQAPGRAKNRKIPPRGAPHPRPNPARGHVPMHVHARRAPGGGLTGNSFTVIAAILLAGLMVLIWFGDPTAIRKALQLSSPSGDNNQTASPKVAKLPEKPAPSPEKAVNPPTTTAAPQVTQTPQSIVSPSPNVEISPAKTPGKTPTKNGQAKKQPQQRPTKPTREVSPGQTVDSGAPVASTMPGTGSPGAGAAQPSTAPAPAANPVTVATTRPVKSKGRISVSSQPAAEIFVNNKKVGTTIDANTSSGWIAVTPGKLTITLRRPGYRDYTRQVSLEPDARLAVGPVVLEKIARENDGASTTADKKGSKALTIVANRWPANVQITMAGEPGKVIKQFRLEKGSSTVQVPMGRINIRIESDGEVKERKIDTAAISGPVTYTVEFSRTKASPERAP